MVNTLRTTLDAWLRMIRVRRSKDALPKYVRRLLRVCATRGCDRYTSGRLCKKCAAQARAFNRRPPVKKGEKR